MKRVWASGIATAGLLIVGLVCGCIWYARPGRASSSDWLLYLLLLLTPYGMTAFGCLLSDFRLIRFSAVVVVAGGAVMLLTAVYDIWPTFSGGPPPSMPASTIIAALVMIVQYHAGLFAAVCGAADYSVLRSAK